MEADDASRYLSELLIEKENLNPSFANAARLLALEIDRVQTDQGQEKMLELHHDKPTSLAVKIRLPVNEYPQVNFAGRIIGSKGSVMRQFQEKTGTKLCVFGKGSMTDKIKEEELRQMGGKYSHLNEEMHVKLEVFANPVECYRRMSVALQELKAYLGPYEVGATGPLIPANGGGGPRAMLAPLWGPGPMRPMQPGTLPHDGAPPIHRHPDPWGANQQAAQMSAQPDPFSAQPDPFSSKKLETFGARSNPFGQRQARPAYPLVEGVSVAAPGPFNTFAARAPASRQPRPGPVYGQRSPAMESSAEQFGGIDWNRQTSLGDGGGRAAPMSTGQRQPRSHPYQAYMNRGQHRPY